MIERTALCAELAAVARALMDAVAAAGGVDNSTVAVVDVIGSPVHPRHRPKASAQVGHKRGRGRGKAG